MKKLFVKMVEIFTGSAGVLARYDAFKRLKKFTAGEDARAPSITYIKTTI